MPPSRRWRLLLAAACALAGRPASAATTLVEEGRPRALIVLAEKPSPAAAEGARVLQEHLRQISGAELPIVPETGLSSGVWVLVGEGRLARERGYSAEGLGPGAFLIAAEDGVVALLGADGRVPADPDGSLYAVTAFLEERLGVRYLWPGESGKVVPRRATVTIPGFKRTSSPALAQRRLRDGRDGRTVRKGLERLGIGEAEFRAKLDAAGRTLAASPDWFRWHGLGGTLGLETGHAFGRLWAEHGKTRPEWFALQPDGTRDQSREPGRARLCKSDPGLVDFVARAKVAELDARPELAGVSIAPNDGGHNSFCSCPRCEALDAPEGARVVLKDFTRLKKREYEHVSLTDRMVWFWNAVAEKVAAARPGKRLVVDAYGPYAAPPVRRRLHPSLVVRFVPMSYLDEEARRRALGAWDGWARSATGMIFRPNLLLGDRSGTAYLFGRRFAEDFRRLAARGMLGTDFDSCLHHWATQGLTYYIAARLNWDPGQDVGAIIDDYCRAGFGAAAQPVRRYFLRLEALTDAAAEGGNLLASFHPATVAELGALLDAADRLVADDPASARRVAFLRAGLRWTEVDARAHALLRAAPGSVTAAERKAVLVERDAAMRGLFQDDFMAVNVAAVSGAEDGLWRRFLPTWGQVRSRLP